VTGGWLLASFPVAVYAAWGLWACTSKDPCRQSDGWWGVGVGVVFFAALSQEITK
jgi:hypothetical protein